MKQMMLVLAAVALMAVSLSAQELEQMTKDQLERQLLIEQIGLVRAQKVAVEQNSAITGEIAKLVPVAKTVLPALFSKMADSAAKRGTGEYPKLHSLQLHDMSALLSECAKDQPDAQVILKLACQMSDRDNRMFVVRILDRLQAESREKRDREDAEARANPPARSFGDWWRSVLKAIVFGGDPGQLNSWFNVWYVACCPLLLICLAATALGWWLIRTRGIRSSTGKIIFVALIMMVVLLAVSTGRLLIK